VWDVLRLAHGIGGRILYGVSVVFVKQGFPG